MHLNDESIGTRGDGGAGNSRDIIRVAGGMRRIEDDRQDASSFSKQELR